MKPKNFFLFISLCFSVLNVFSQYGYLQMPMTDGEIETIPTFNSCSYYYRQSCDASFSVEYKKVSETDWHSAHPTVCDQPENIHKGSLFYLSEDVEYQIRILAGIDNKVVALTTFRTWNSTPRIAKTIDLSTLSNTANEGIVITEQGSPDAWIKYTAPSDWIVKRTLRDFDTLDAVIVLKEAKYIILENIKVEGGKRHAILVENCDYVRILNCELSGWGRTGVQVFDNPTISADNTPIGWYRDAEGKWINLDGGIQIIKSYATVVERCYLHDPRGRANSWIFSHPSGPQAIVAGFTRGGNVIRWNDFVGSDEHRWNDVIEGFPNDSPEGGLFRDSDIIGNYLAYANDNGIELEGGGMNLRFIGNKLEGIMSDISFGANLIGPQYAVGNVSMNPGDEVGNAGTFLKNSHGIEQKGKRFVYNNTFHNGLNPHCGAFGGFGSATPENASLSTMRNNIFVCTNALIGDWVRAQNFDYDLYWINNSFKDTENFLANIQNYGQEKNALIGDPQLVYPIAGNYHFTSTSLGRGKAVEVTGITREGDDIGAFFNGVTDLPLRPLALTATPTQINYLETGGIDTVTLNLSADAKKPVEFQVRQNIVFDWFTVNPTRGIIAPGETLKLVITADPTKLSGRPIFRGAFLVRTPNGLSRPVTVYAKGTYTEVKHPATAGPNTIYFDPTNNLIDTKIIIPKDGVYALLARAYIRIPWRDTLEFDISINGKSSTATYIHRHQWQWNEGTADRVVWLNSLGQLNAGTNHINVKTISQNVSVVEYIITDNPAIFFIQERNARR